MRVRLAPVALAAALIVAMTSDGARAQPMPRPDIAAAALPDGSWELGPGGVVALFHALAGSPAPDGAAALAPGDAARLYRLRVPFAMRADGAELRLEPLLGFLGTSASAGGVVYTLRVPVEAERLVVTGAAAERLRPLLAGGAVVAGDLLFQATSYSEAGDGSRAVDVALRRLLLTSGNRELLLHAIDVSAASGDAATSAAMAQQPTDTPPAANAGPPPLPAALLAPLGSPPPLPAAITTPPPSTPPVVEAPPPANPPPLPAAIPPVAIFQPQTPPPATATPASPTPSPATQGQASVPEPAPATAAAAPPGEPVFVAERAGVIRNAPSSRALQVGQVRAGQRFALVREARSSDNIVWAEVKPLPDGAAGFVPRRDLVSLDEWQAPVRGAVTRVVDAATLVVGERTVLLGGLEAGPKRLIEVVRPWLTGAASPLACERRADAAFDCFSADKRDVGETMILNGLAKAGPGAADYYREAEEKARAGKKGLWRGTK